MRDFGSDTVRTNYLSLSIWFTPRIQLIPGILRLFRVWGGRIPDGTNSTRLTAWQAALIDPARPPPRGPDEHLFVAQEPVTQLRVIDPLHRHAVVDRQRRRGRRRLPHHEKDRLHADRPVADVRRRQTHRHQQI